jgi:hypothetical protein
MPGNTGTSFKEDEKCKETKLPDHQQGVRLVKAFML